MALSPHQLAFPAIVLGSIMLAFGPLLVRLADVAPVASAFWRLGLAVLPLALLARVTGAPLAGGLSAPLAGGLSAPLARGTINARMLALTALAGMCFAADIALWHEGIMRTTMANAALLSNAASFMLPLWGFVVLGHRPGRKALLALGFAIAGTLLLVGQSAELSPRHLAGDLLCLGAALLYTGYLIVIDGLRGRVPVFPLLALATGFGAVALLPAALLLDGRFWPQDWTPLVALALGSQVMGQGLVVFAIGHLRPIVVGLGLLVQPVVAATIGALGFGEVPGLPELAGAALVVVALILVRLPERPQR